MTIHKTMRMRSFAYLCFALAIVLIAVGTLQARPPKAQQTATAHAAFDPANATTTPGYYTIERVVDGDTIVVWKGGEDVTVRLIGMDTPETLDPRKPVSASGRKLRPKARKS